MIISLRLFKEQYDLFAAHFWDDLLFAKFRESEYLFEEEIDDGTFDNESNIHIDKGGRFSYKFDHNGTTYKMYNNSRQKIIKHIKKANHYLNHQWI